VKLENTGSDAFLLFSTSKANARGKKTLESKCVG